MGKKTNRKALDRLREMIHQNDDEAAIKRLCDTVKEQDRNAYNEAILQQSRLKDIAQRERRGVLAAADAQTQRTRVRFALLELIDEVERRIARDGTGKTSTIEQQAPPVSPKGDGIEKVTPSADLFDVFLSHNSADKPIVRRVGEALKRRNLSVWLDEWELAPGRTWMDALEDIVTTCKSAAVCVGENGIGPWEAPEMQALLRRFIAEKKTGQVVPVIPVLLPEAPDDVKLPVFLEAFTWVDLRDGLEKEGLDRLQWGITGVKPSG